VLERINHRNIELFYSELPILKSINPSTIKLNSLKLPIANSYEGVISDYNKSQGSWYFIARTLCLWIKRVCGQRYANNYWLPTLERRTDTQQQSLTRVLIPAIERHIAVAHFSAVFDKSPCNRPTAGCGCTY